MEAADCLYGVSMAGNGVVQGRLAPAAAGARGRAGRRVAADHQAALVAALRGAGVAPDRVVEAFARVPRHAFLPGVEPAAVYADDAVVTRTGPDGIATSSSSQPSLMAAMLARLDVRPATGAGDRRRHGLQRRAAGRSGRARRHRHRGRHPARGRRGGGGEPAGRGRRAGRGRLRRRGRAARRPVRPGHRHRGLLVAAHRPGRGRGRGRGAPRAAVRERLEVAVAAAAGGRAARRLRRRRRAPSCRWPPRRSGRGAGRSAAAAGRRRTPTSARRATAPSTACWPARRGGRPASTSATGSSALDALLWLGLRGDPLIVLLRARPARGAAAVARSPWPRCPAPC